jgi:hypothetical protein
MEAWYKVITPRKKSKKGDLVNASIGNPLRDRHSRGPLSGIHKYVIGSPQYPNRSP